MIYSFIFIYIYLFYIYLFIIFYIYYIFFFFTLFFYNFLYYFLYYFSFLYLFIYLFSEIQLLQIILCLVLKEKSSGRSAHYKLTSTAMLWLQTSKAGSGTMNLGGSLTRQVLPRLRFNLFIF